ncbi:MAG: hypothetical protein PWQ57_1692 [Desulfovibrionales bacterium]|nr:hypothetical protein [Desulfovibrionales bacterium]
MKTLSAVLFLGLALPLIAVQSAPARSPLEGKNILWVDSYHQGYAWSDGIEQGIRETLAGTGVRLDVFRMDTKRHPSVAAMRQAGEKALAAIQRKRPDVVIASDENAQRYLVTPYLMKSDRPVVFCGVNWDASVYGYPTKHITGMVEVEGVLELRQLLRKSAKGDRVGFIGGATATIAKIADYINSRYFQGALNVYLFHNFEEFKEEFLRAQQEVDLLFVRSYAGVADWPAEEAESFVLANTRIPTGSHLDFMAPYAIYVMSKDPTEQGEFAAQTALKILQGVSPADIPVAYNKRVKLTVNMDLALAANVVAPMSVLRVATIFRRPNSAPAKDSHDADAEASNRNFAQ